MNRQENQCIITIATKNSEVTAGLYDLRCDPGERYNVIEFYPEIVSKLEKIAAAAREDLGDDLTGD